MTTPTISLDVEGVLFKTAISTLTAVKGSYFDRFFQHDWRDFLDKVVSILLAEFGSTTDDRIPTRLEKKVAQRMTAILRDCVTDEADVESEVSLESNVSDALEWDHFDSEMPCTSENIQEDIIFLNGHLFIDRDSTIFPLILNYLRDGSIPLPRDEYYLERILREARFFKLHTLCGDIERRISYVARRRAGVAPKSFEKSRRESSEVEKKVLPTEGSDQKKPAARVSAEIEAPLVPLCPRSKRFESISLPRNFAHVAHVGWNGGGVIFDERLLDKNSTVRAIIDAANNTDLNPVYNVVSGENEGDPSHTVEVVLAGSLMQTRDPLYNKHQKKSTKAQARRAILAAPITQ